MVIKNRVRKRKIFIFFIVLISMTFFAGCTKKNELNDFGLTEKNIVAKFEYGSSMDVLVRKKDNVEFYYFEKQEENKDKLINKMTITSKFAFDYSAKKNLEDVRNGKFEKSVRDEIDVIRAIYREQKDVSDRHPFYGVSITPEIQNISINGKKADEIIEYSYKENQFYVWYFEDIDLKSDDYILEFDGM